MDFPHFHARRTFRRPELIPIRCFSALLIELFQFISITAIPDAVADCIQLKIHHFLSLDAVGACLLHIQPGTDAPFYILVQCRQPPHFSSSSNPIRFLQGIQPYWDALIVWSFRSSGSSLSSSQEYRSSSAICSTQVSATR